MYVLAYHRVMHRPTSAVRCLWHGVALENIAADEAPPIRIGSTQGCSVRRSAVSITAGRLWVGGLG